MTFIDLSNNQYLAVNHTNCVMSSNYKKSIMHAKQVCHIWIPYTYYKTQITEKLFETMNKTKKKRDSIQTSMASSNGNYLKTLFYTSN